MKFLDNVLEPGIVVAMNETVNIQVSETDAHIISYALKVSARALRDEAIDHPDEFEAKALNRGAEMKERLAMRIDTARQMARMMAKDS